MLHAILFSPLEIDLNYSVEFACDIFLEKFFFFFMGIFQTRFCIFYHFLRKIVSEEIEM